MPAVVSALLGSGRRKISNQRVSTAIAIFDTFRGIEHCLFGFKYSPPGWELPGGKLEPDELLADAAAREAFEETGLVVEPVSLGCYVEHDGYICFLFGGVPLDGDLTLREPNKHREWGWFPCDEFPQPLVPYAKESLLVLSETYHDTAYHDTTCPHEVCLN